MDIQTHHSEELISFADNRNMQMRTKLIHILTKLET